MPAFFCAITDLPDHFSDATTGAGYYRVLISARNSDEKDIIRTVYAPSDYAAAVKVRQQTGRMAYARDVTFVAHRPSFPRTASHPHSSVMPSPTAASS